MLWRLRRFDMHLLLLLAITVIVNVPFLSSRFVFVCDSLNYFIHFHYAYSQFYLYGEFPRWNPYAAYGILFDFGLLVGLQTTDYAVLLFGWAFRIENVLLLAKISFILDDCLFVLGLYLLARKLFNSLPAVWMVCLGGILTNDWTFSLAWCFNTYYLMPLVFYFLLLFLEEGKPVHLWLAGIIELLSLLGTIPYVPPVHLLIIGTFLTPFVWRDPWILLRFVYWRNFVHPLFFVFAMFAFLLGGLAIGMDAEFVRAGRDSSGNIALEEFVRWGRHPLGAMARSMVRGDISRIEIALYVGYLPLALAIYAMLRRRDAPLIAFAATALVLFWFALGGWFTTWAYYAVPLMKKYRLISYAVNSARMMLLFVGGFGFDQLVRDLKGANIPAAAGRGGRWVVLGLLIVLLEDFRRNYRSNDLAGWESYGFEFGSLPVGSGGLLARCLLYMGVFAMVFLVARRQRNSGRLASSAAIPLLLLAVYVIDAGWFYLQIVKNAPFCGPGVAMAQVFQVRPLEYSSRHLPLFSQLSEPGDSDAFRRQLAARSGSELPGNALKAITSPRPGFDHRSSSIAFYLWMNYDILCPELGIEQIMPGVKTMLQAHGVTVSGGGRPYEPACVLPDGGKDSLFLESLGYSSNPSAKVNKIRIVRNARITGNLNEAIEWFKAKNENPRDQLIIVHPGTGDGKKTSPSSPANRPDSEPKVDQFTANRQVVTITAGAPGWLFLADAYHPGWEATVDGQPTDVVRANIGCKAVYLDEGKHTVAFYFGDGLRGLLHRAFYLFAAVLSCLLIVGLFPSPWLVHDFPESRWIVTAPTGVRLAVPIWSGVATLTALMCALWITAGLTFVTLTIVGVTALGLLALRMASRAP